MAFRLMNYKNTFTVGPGIIGKADNKSGCSVDRNMSEKFFYSNSPENVLVDWLADVSGKVGGKWLAKEYVSGSGQLYTWHINKAGAPINSIILMYNPSKTTSVTVTFSNIGLTNGPGANDRAAWEKYYNASSTPVTVTLQPGEFKNALAQNGISNFNNFGKVARFAISGPGVYFYDLAYKSNSGTATTWAGKDPDTMSPTRGLGDGFYETMTVRLTLTDQAATQAFSIGGSTAAIHDDNDSFSGRDLIKITDSAPAEVNRSWELFGNYGVQMRINLTINNQCSSAKKVRIFMGSYAANGGYAFCRFNKQFYTAYTQLIKGPYEYIDVLYDDAFPRGESTVTFDYVVPATASAPSIIGARWVY